MFLYFNNFKMFHSVEFMIALIGKLALWETRNQFINEDLVNPLVSMKINFKYKLLKWVQILYEHNSASSIIFLLSDLEVMDIIDGNVHVNYSL